LPDLGSVKAEIDKIDEVISRVVARNINECERAIDLHSGQKEFCDAVTRAITNCFLVHMMNSNRRPFRGVRKELLLVSRQARLARNSLTALQAALNALPPKMSEILANHRSVLGEIARGSLNHQTAWLDRESRIANIAAEAIKGKKSGRPSLSAFRQLVKGLAVAYQQVTGRAAPASHYRFRGLRTHSENYVHEVTGPTAGKRKRVRRKR
jgi:hypothetical protein